MQCKKRRRLLVEGRSAVYHVLSRTVCQTFLFGDREKAIFCGQLRKQAAFAGVEVLAYCVMSNHFHLLVRVPVVDALPDAELLLRYREYYGEEKEPISTYSVAELEKILREGGRAAEIARQRILNRMGHLPSFMRELKQRFSIWFNHQHDTVGTVWAARYKSLIVEDAPEVLTKVAAYIDLNPVRAEIVSDPLEYHWCGYAAALAGDAEARAGVQGLFCLKRGFAEAIAAYRLILYGKGYGGKSGSSQAGGRVSGERLEQIIRQKGKVPFEELARARVRYFSDGLALGSMGFMETVFQTFRASFGKNRKGAGTPLPGEGKASVLYSFRKLQKNVYG